MYNNIVMIFKSIETIHELENEFSKRFGWLRFKDKKEYKKLRNKVIDCINSLYNDRWTIKYLYELQNSLLIFNDIIEKYSNEYMYISNQPLFDDSIPVFKPMYFIDQEKDDRLISLEIVSNNISFRIMDTKTGNTFESTSIDEVQSTQKKIEGVCKHCMVQMIFAYLNKK